MFLLVPAHPGCPGQIPQSHKTVVCVCVCVVLSIYIVLLNLFLKILVCCRTCPHDVADISFILLTLSCTVWLISFSFVNLIRHYYGHSAFIRDIEQPGIMLTYLQGLRSFISFISTFAVDPLNSVLLLSSDQW